MSFLLLLPLVAAAEVEAFFGWTAAATATSESSSSSSLESSDSSDSPSELELVTEEESDCGCAGESAHAPHSDLEGELTSSTTGVGSLGSLLFFVAGEAFRGDSQLNSPSTFQHRDSP